MPKTLSKRQKEMVREWLELDDLNKECGCPFHYDEWGPERRHLVCYSWFPKLRDRNCPCNRYALSTVIKRAKRMVK